MEIDLGFAEKQDDVAWLSNRYFPSKLGGQPAWLELESLPATTVLQCSKCKAPKSFLAQLYSPFEDEFNFHRSIYVFLCRNPDCQQPQDASNFTVLRSQLPLKNKFFSEEDPDDEGDPLPAIPCWKKLCAACGCLAPHACSKCKAIHYCSSEHQRAHWPQHKPSCGSSSSARHEPLGNVEFPEFEIVMDSNPTNSAENEKDDETRLAEFEELEASGKTGELSNVSEAELDKYFGQTAAADDKTFRQFKKKTAAEPEQIIRYQRGGSPLWITDTTKTVQDRLESLPNCSACGGARQFEFQIMPQALTLLEDENLDWGVLAVYTCARSCPIEGYVEEVLVKQDIVAEEQS
ncbi:programmed cell death protein 2 [Drosophila bipectinata]|uniref:programmed cell death protein 2 n=1 Tax=Drosophila bipectinata TaxID=42026 RepID=UPI001C892D4B|nr:programmed cell death protein 2 [Drosophila bipectinata]